MIAQATETPRKPSTLPWIRTLNTIIAKPKDTSRIISEISAPLSALPISIVVFEIGALRRRLHRPRCRSSSISTPMLAIAKSRNWIAIPANECA